MRTLKGSTSATSPATVRRALAPSSGIHWRILPVCPFSDGLAARWLSYWPELPAFRLHLCCSCTGAELMAFFCRLVEALETYEPGEEGFDPMMDSYQSESARSQLLGGGMGKQHRRVRP